MENSEIKDRILKLLNTENMSSAKFADLIGVQRSNISHILSGRNNPGLDFLQKVLVKFPSVNSEWLLIGKGEMFKQLQQKEINFEKQSNLLPPFEQTQTFSETQTQKEIPIRPIVQKVKSIKQVMVLYDDNTFEVLNPEKTDLEKEAK